MKKIISFISICAIILSLTGCATTNTKNEKLNIVTTTFSTYDFVRQIAGDNVNLICLLNPGEDTHSFEPTPQDIIKINNADLFIYVGGEMESWIEKTKNSITLEENKMCSVMDFVTLLEEKEIDGAEEHHHDEEHEEEHHEDEIEYNEHVWTSLDNSIKIINSISNTICSIDSKNKDIYESNAKSYIKEIEDLKKEIEEIVENASRKKLVFGDKMPMQYFIEEFGLEVSAAFSGCSTETEPSASTISYLVNVVKEEKIPVVLYIELSSGKVADIIAQETGVKAMRIQTLHNISKEDFNNGETYVSLMRKNINVLKEALN